MKRKLYFMLILLNCFVAKSQELMVSGGVSLPLNPYSGGDILDNSNGHAATGYNFKFDYIFLKQSKLNFSLGTFYFSNDVNISNLERQYNKAFGKQSVFTLATPYTGLGIGGSILYYIGKQNSKIKGISKISLGQMFVNSPEYTVVDSNFYQRALSNDASSTFWGLGLGIEYAVSPQLSLIGFAEYLYSRVDFGNPRSRNVAGQIITTPSNSTNAQAVINLNINVGLSYKFYSYEDKLTPKLKPKK